MTDPTDTETSLRRALDFVPQGIVVFDAELKLVASNQRYRELLALPEEMLQAGTVLYDITHYVARRGDLGPGDPHVLAKERLELLLRPEGSVSQRLGQQGQILEFHSARLPDGGVTISFVDVTARVGAEEALEEANATGGAGGRAHG
jgi:PAS domain-containing protein